MQREGGARFPGTGRAAALLLLAVIWVPACIGGEASGPAAGVSPLGATPQGSGPRVVFDPLTRPVPEVPFPNDVATVLDPRSPTGRRVNIRMHAPTGLESGIRDRINGLAVWALIMLVAVLLFTIGEANSERRRAFYAAIGLGIVVLLFGAIGGLATDFFA